MVTRAIAVFLLAAAYNIDIVVIGAGGIGRGVMEGKPFLQGIIEILNCPVSALIVLLGPLPVAGMWTYDFIKSGGKFNWTGFRAAVGNFLFLTVFLFNLVLIGDGVIHAMMGESFLKPLEEGVPVLIGLLGSALVAGALTYKFVKNEKAKKSLSR